MPNFLGEVNHRSPPTLQQAESIHSQHFLNLWNPYFSSLLVATVNIDDTEIVILNFELRNPSIILWCSWLVHQVNVGRLLASPSLALNWWIFPTRLMLVWANILDLHHENIDLLGHLRWLLYLIHWPQRLLEGSTWTGAGDLHAGPFGINPLQTLAIRDINRKRIIFSASI